MVKYAQLNPTLYITRETQKFIYTMLDKESQNKVLCKNMIMAISEPIINNKFNGNLHGIDLSDVLEDQQNQVCTTFDLITSIYDNILFKNMDYTIPDMFEELCDLTSRTVAFIEAWMTTRLFKNIQPLWILICFYKLKKGLNHDRLIIDDKGWQNYRSLFCHVQINLIKKNQIIDSLRSNKLALIYWKKLQTLRPFEMPHGHKFDHQNIALMITPMGSLMKRELMQNDCGKIFIDKLFDVTCQPVQRVCYDLRDAMDKEKINAQYICKASIEMLIEIIDVMDRSTAVITFQSMLHTLRNFMPNNGPYMAKKNDVNNKQKFTTQTIFDGDPIVDNPLILPILLDGIAIMTNKFQFKWADCLETICVLTLAQGILNNPGAQPNLCVKALQLCKLSIQNFMPPNLALLVESDSNMNDIGTTLYKRLHDQNWEVRDSVLEVLTTIATISENKYPAFQDILIHHKFLTVAIDIFMNDNESYVRASAIKFIYITIKIDKLWNEELSNLNLPDKIIKLFNNESEAIVRKESVTLIKELYIFRKWHKSMTDEMIRTMADAAVNDLHWEVKINALEFWRYFIKLQLQDQGMLDGCFPNVTFSKDDRKIVSLNENEIKRRLNKALDNMAKNNCLGVLIATLNDECDFEVSKTSADIIKNLKEILLKYKIDQPEPAELSLKDCPTIDTNYIKTPIVIENNSHDDSAIKILDEIVDSNDANLLSKIYENSLNIDNNNELKKIQKIINITREKFLCIILSTDVEIFIDEKKKWLNNYTISYDSVLEDIITVYNQKGINNTMDCY